MLRKSKLTKNQRAMLEACNVDHAPRFTGKRIDAGRRLVARGLLSEPFAKTAGPGKGVHFQTTDAGRAALRGET